MLMPVSIRRFLADRTQCGLAYATALRVSVCLRLYGMYSG